MKYGAHIIGAPRARRRSHTLDEAIAVVRAMVEDPRRNNSWEDFEILHEDGRRWYWEMQGRHGVIKVDNPPKAD